MSDSKSKKDAPPPSDDKSKFEIPSWATVPPPGSHLDVIKNNELLNKLMIDDKKAYYFGRQNTQVDFTVEHASCSRVHALLLYHKLLNRFALVDMGSSHGTYIGNLRIKPLEVVFIEVGSQFHLGASKRHYAVRLRSESGAIEGIDDEGALNPNDEQLDHQTEYNTAQNRRIPQLPISLEEARRKKRPRGNISFLDAEEIINPEDVDPSVGRFRNLVQTAVISNNPNKRTSSGVNRADVHRKIIRPSREVLTAPLSSSFGGMPLNAAPDLELYGQMLPKPGYHEIITEDEGPITKKKKYAKESWPGREPNAPY